MANNKQADPQNGISQQLGNYRLVRSLGSGSFAFVYLGEHIYLKRLAAIKVLRTVLSEQEMRRFLEEARLLANLSHPHIVRVLEFAVAQRAAMQNSQIKELVPFLVMDYAPAGNLRSTYPEGTRVALALVIDIIKQVADALQYAHEQNIIHRDIKPENLLMNERQEVMLSDFGLALFAPSADVLNRQRMAGTLAYTAPEQLQGRPSFASDQYSLGIITYEWLCGTRPFEGEDVEIIMQQVSSPPPRLQSKNPLIMQAVEEVVLKALAKDPQHRYQSVQAFAQALEEASQIQAAHKVTRPVKAIALLPTTVKREFPAFHYFAQKAVIAPPIEQNNVDKAAIATLIEQERADFTETLNLEGKHAVGISPSTMRNRLRMIQKVRAFWINGVLKQSLRGASFITLGLDERQDAVASAWSSMRQQGEKQIQPLAAGTTITKIYEMAGGELLILGEAGSGKTTLLLELARNLLDRAERDERAPIPVILPLSSWTEKQLPLDEWFIEELKSKYQVPHLLGEQWMHNEMFLPLLDGLDEVAANVRSACIIAINRYKEEHGLNSLVVCSRLTDYLLYPPRVLLNSAIVVRPLTGQQIEEYLQHSTGKNFAVLSHALRNDLILQQMMTKPLMLNIMALACQNKSSEEILQMCRPEGRYQRIFRIYVEQMLHRYQTTTTSSAKHLTEQLAYLAMQMQRHNQTVFYLEQLQPDWIEDKRWLEFYRWFAVMLPGALIGALTGILSNVLFFHAGSIGVIYIDAVYGTVIGYLLSGKRAMNAKSAEQAPVVGNLKSASFKGEGLKAVLFVGLITFLFMGASKGWSAGLVNGIILGGLSFPLSLHFQKSSQEKSYSRGVQKRGKREKLRLRSTSKKPGQTQTENILFSFEHFKKGTLVGLACGLTSIVTILVNQKLSSVSIAFLLTLGIRDSLRNVLLGTLLSALLTKNDGLIHRTEIVSWSWKIAWQSLKDSKNILFDGLFGIAIGVIFAGKQLFQGNMGSTVSAGLSTGVLTVISLRLVHIVLRGVSSRNLDNHYRTRPNEGIRRSLFHSLVGGTIGIFVTTLLSIITTVIALLSSSGLVSLLNSKVLQASLKIGLSNALLLGPSGGLLAGLLLGGLAFLQYNILRIILWRTGNVPRNLFLLLEDAAGCILLHKVGGGYLFTHRFLLEYFASLHRKRGQRGKPQFRSAKLLDKA